MPKEKQLHVTIAGRDDGRWMAAVYDHLAISNKANIQTYVAHDGDMGVQNFTRHIESGLYAFKHTPIVLPANDFGPGLLVLPGESRKTPIKRPDDLLRRKAFEKKLVIDALKRGRPILAICGGGYHLFEFLGGALVRVKGHDYGAAYPDKDLTLDKHGQIINNIAVHQVEVREGTLLHSMMNAQQPNPRFATNSIHLFAIDSDGKKTLCLNPTLGDIPRIFHIRVSAKADKSCLAQEMDLNTPEAFELYYPSKDDAECFAAPMLSTQWHLEAYSDGPSRQILKHMIEAGRTFEHRLALNKEIKALGFNAHQSFFKNQKSRPETLKPLEATERTLRK